MALEQRQTDLGTEAIAIDRAVEGEFQPKRQLHLTRPRRDAILFLDMSAKLLKTSRTSS